MIEHFHIYSCSDWGPNLARTNRKSESRKNWAKARGSFKLYRALGQIRWLHTRKSFSKGRKDKESIAAIYHHILSITINFNQLLSYESYTHVDIIAGMNEPVYRAYCWGTRVAFTRTEHFPSHVPTSWHFLYLVLLGTRLLRRPRCWLPSGWQSQYPNWRSIDEFVRQPIPIRYFRIPRKQTVPRPRKLVSNWMNNDPNTTTRPTWLGVLGGM